MSFFQSHGLDPLLIKGWAVARQYPAAALRPYTDTDLAFGSAELEAARRIFRDLPEECGPVDLHGLPEEWRDREWSDLRSRASYELAAGVAIRIPSPEDHLRLMAIHAMKHGVFRPLWLCDLGMAVESRGEQFDWERFCYGDRWLTGCALSALRLSGSLLGADLRGTPLEGSLAPRWMERAVLKEWGDPYRWPHGHAPMAEVIRTGPLSMVRELLRRWPGAIEASYNLKAPWNRLQRFPFQVGELVRRIPSIRSQLRAEPPARSNNPQSGEQGVSR